MQTANQNFNEFKYGVKIQGVNVSGGQLPVTFAANTSGNVAVSVFPTGTSSAPTNGSVIGFFVTNLAVAAAGTFVLWGTTAGTIATISTLGTLSGLAGVTVGTNVLTASVTAGDALQVSSTSNAGTAACFVLFQTVS